MTDQNYRPENIFSIASSIQTKLEQSILDMREVYEKSHVLSINARIEAARTGIHGVGFKIVAQEFSELNEEIDKITALMSEHIHKETDTLMTISDGMAKQVRGQRLSQISLSIMDVIDRNLYERTCDVRWWATDPSVFNALDKKSNETTSYASERLGVILDAYTVYLDLVLVDSNGTIIANGRPNKFNSVGSVVKKEEWFKEALNSPSMDFYSFQETHSSTLVKNKEVLIYGCKIDCPDNKTPLGVLGILFNWKGLCSAVIDRVMNIDLNDDINVLKLKTEISIINSEGIVLFSTDKYSPGDKFRYNRLYDILKNKNMGHHIDYKDNMIELTAFGYSPGFETYQTGWFCIINQWIKK